MFSSVVKSTTSNRAILLSSHHNRLKPRRRRRQASSRSESVFSTKSYNDGLQRAFNKAKQQIYFNPDMKYFVTLTYAGLDHSIEDVLYDIKQFLKKEKRSTGENLKYIWVAEYQKRGSIHVHMITNGAFKTHLNKNNYLSLTNWTLGYSSVLKITDFDNNFRPYLYLFKYMRKTQRIGKSFLHSSRNLSNFETVEISDIDMESNFVHHQERTEATLDGVGTFVYYRYFLDKEN